jgi:hypothetical protein
MLHDTTLGALYGLSQYHKKKVQGGAPYLAKLVPVTPISLWFMVDISIMLDAD